MGSRKFWLAVATFISALAALFFDLNLPVEPMVAAGAIISTYMIGQSWVDKSTVEGQAGIIGNETLIQAQAYIKYLEAEMEELASDNQEEG